jgi:hypothetical protein
MPLVVTKFDRLARLLPAAREHRRGHNENLPGVLAADRDDHRVLIPKSQQVMQFQPPPAMKEYAATPLSTSRGGAAKPAATNKNGPPHRPIKGDLYTVSGPQAPEQGKHVPEVGLELHALPRKHWARVETCGIRTDPAPVRPDPTPEMCTMYTRQIGQLRALRPHSPSRAGCSEFCATRLSERDSGQPQHQAQRCHTKQKVRYRPSNEGTIPAAQPS